MHHAQSVYHLILELSAKCEPRGCDNRERCIRGVCLAKSQSTKIQSSKGCVLEAKLPFLQGVRTGGEGKS